MVLGRSPDPSLKRWHRCRKWEERNMPCPFTHEGEKEPPKSRDPRTPFDWIKDWYLRDVNISRRVGWEGPTHDAFVYPFKAFDQALQRLIPKEQLDGMDVGGRFKEVLERFSKWQMVAEGRERYPRPEPPLAEGFWPPERDKSLVEYTAVEPPPRLNKRIHDRYWAETALAETIKPELGRGIVLPAATPSGFPITPAEGGGTTFGGGFGGYNTMADTFQKMRDLITPSFRQSDSGL